MNDNEVMYDEEGFEIEPEPVKVKSYLPTVKKFINEINEVNMMETAYRVLELKSKICQMEEYVEKMKEELYGSSNAAFVMQAELLTAEEVQAAFHTVTGRKAIFEKVKDM